MSSRKEGDARPLRNRPVKRGPTVKKDALTPNAVPNREAGRAAARPVGPERPSGTTFSPHSALPGDLDEIAELIRCCRLCGLSEGRKNAVPGEGSPRARIVLVGEAPGAKEDAQGRPFVGMSGKLLTKLLKGIGLNREDVFITNVVKCRPPKNRPPKPAEVQACHLYLAKQLRLIGPELVCTLGNSSLRALVDPKGNITQAHGKLIEKDGQKYLPLYHPAAILYRRRLMAEMESDTRKLKRLAVLRNKGLDTFLSSPADKDRNEEE